jgi:hypothetical protein
LARNKPAKLTEANIFQKETAPNAVIKTINSQRAAITSKLMPIDPSKFAAGLKQYEGIPGASQLLSNALLAPFAATPLGVEA